MDWHSNILWGMAPLAPFGGPEESSVHFESAKRKEGGSRGKKGAERRPGSLEHIHAWTGIATSFGGWRLWRPLADQRRLASTSNRRNGKKVGRVGRRARS